MSSRSKPLALAAIQANNDIPPPLDFSFKNLSGIQDATDEEPRLGPHKSSKTNTDSGQLKSDAKILRFCYNKICDLQYFNSTLEQLLEKPFDLEWLDLSFNDISTIDEVLLQYPKLKILYLHGNQIDKLSEVDKLGALPELFSITLHGNPIEDIPGYKQYVISALPQLKVFNTITITNQDRSDASTWKRKFRKK